MTSYPGADRALRAIRRSAVLPVLREPDQARLLAHADRLLASLFDVVEPTTTTPGWQTCLARLRAQYPDAVLGVGTVLDADHPEGADLPAALRRRSQS
ncbi:hypothetical protein [Embleya scabrispora]|uniref:hypothetical protein n=1 Tax=Embleya scabrispora TaxID=159449 RepID=UPI00036DB1CD|nr:hypothetical protein [Embleya scabrispora]MYS86565.1 hypothetical protein [Streptomyces sp. SID5474]